MPSFIFEKSQPHIFLQELSSNYYVMFQSDLHHIRYNNNNQVELYYQE